MQILEGKRFVTTNDFPNDFIIYLNKLHVIIYISFIIHVITNHQIEYINNASAANVNHRIK